MKHYKVFNFFIMIELISLLFAANGQAAWQKVSGGVKVSAHSTVSLFITFTSPVVTDETGVQYRSVVCINNVCNHYPTTAEVKPEVAAILGYQSFFGDVNESGASTKFQGLPVYSPLVAGAYVTHKGFKMKLDPNSEPDWKFTEFGGYSKMHTTCNWRTNGSTLGLSLDVYNNPDYYGTMPVKPPKVQ